MVLPLVPPKIKSVKLPVEPTVRLPAMSSEPALAPPAIVKELPLSRLAEKVPPIVRLAIVGLISMSMGLFVALVMTALAVLEFGTVLGVQLLALLHKSETLPFQVWALISQGQLSTNPDSNNTGTIGANLPRECLMRSNGDRLMSRAPVIDLASRRTDVGVLPSYFGVELTRSSHSCASLRKIKSPGAASAVLNSDGAFSR
jgi:hypothetical protein